MIETQCPGRRRRDTGRGLFGSVCRLGCNGVRSFFRLKLLLQPAEASIQLRQHVPGHFELLHGVFASVELHVHHVPGHVHHDALQNALGLVIARGRLFNTIGRERLSCKKIARGTCTRAHFLTTSVCFRNSPTARLYNDVCQLLLSALVTVRFCRMVLTLVH